MFIYIYRQEALICLLDKLTRSKRHKKGALLFLNCGFKFSQSGALVEELNRVNAENKKLTETLTVMCENYNVLRSQLMEYMSKNLAEKELTPSRKRKSESSNNNSTANILAMNNGTSESSSTDEESCKKPKEEPTKAKISRAYVKTEASDSSLVSVQYLFIH